MLTGVAWHFRPFTGTIYISFECALRSLEYGSSTLSIPQQVGWDYLISVVVQLVPLADSQKLGDSGSAPQVMMVGLRGVVTGRLDGVWIPDSCPRLNRKREVESTSLCIHRLLGKLFCFTGVCLYNNRLVFF